MKRELTDENFEEFLRSSADNLRMRAPDKIWKTVSKELHKRRRRFILTLSTLFILTSAVSYYSLYHSSTQVGIYLQAKNKQPSPTTINTAIPKIRVTPKTSVIVPSIALPVSRPYVIRNNNNAIGAEHSLAIAEPVTRTATTNHQVLKPTENNVVFDNSSFSSVMDSYMEFDQQQPAARDFQSNFLAGTNTYPLTIESVLNSFKTKLRSKKIETQFYFTPTISYRKLTENKSYLRGLSSSQNYTALYSSVNNNVTHKPDIGFELGLTGKYPISKNIKLRSGFQFNVNRYDIKAFSSSMEIATIALNTQSRVDSLNTLSNYSNINGYKSNWLRNLSFQFSVPVGVEILLPGNDKFQFGIATTIQPTYVLGDRAYLITTDYKNYAQVPWLTRRWNVNTALETFVTYNTGKTKWQVGPQVRYQLLSSFISKYPVKENLFDFGLKVGVSLNK